MRKDAVANDRAWGAFCVAFQWILRLGYLALTVLFVQSMFPLHSRWAGLLVAGMAVMALFQLLLSYVREALKAGSLSCRTRRGLSGGGALEGALEWKDVTWCSPKEDKPALRRVSFRLTAGITVVLGVERGLFGLLSTGRLKADEGIVYYGITPIEGISEEEIARKVTLLSGYDAPPAETIAALMRAEEEKGRTLARELGLHSLIQAAGGYQAPTKRLSEGGLILARIAAALADKPRLLILEHLLEHLDEASADNVLETAERHGVDCVAVGTRACLPRRFDRVLEFRGDTLLFQGTRDEFLAWEEAGHERDIS